VLSPAGPSGRHLWLETVRNFMENGAKVLVTHRGRIAEPFGDLQWPLPDHPVLRLNWNSESDYNFGGGWNLPGTEIMTPLSPRHLLYVKVGAKMNISDTSLRSELPRLYELKMQELIHQKRTSIFTGSRSTAQDTAPWATEPGTVSRGAKEALVLLVVTRLARADARGLPLTTA